MALQEVKVVSHHSHTHKDKHHGVEYVFPPNKEVLVPLAAGVHFFGVGLPADAPARIAAWKRNGFTDPDKGEAYLKKFECTIVNLVPEGSDMGKLAEDHEKEVGELKSSHETELAKLEADHREEMQAARTAHDKEVGELKARIAELEGKGKKK